MMKADMIDGDAIFPALGPLPLSDVDGMGAAAIQLLKTLDPGINEALVQHSTAKVVTTSLAASWAVSVHSKGETVMVRAMLQSYVPNHPVTSQWCERFMLGVHERMVTSVKQY